MRETEDLPVTPQAVRVLADKHNASVAQREMDYTIWKFGDDIHDIGDGPNPVGDKVTVVHGLPLAIEQAKLLMRRDVTIRFMHLVPKRPSSWCKPVRIGRRIIKGSSRETLDPSAGLDDFKRE